MADWKEHEERSQKIADSLRGFLIGINTGGVGVTLSVASWLATHDIHPRWSIAPVLCFVLAIVLVGVDFHLAKHREIKRRDAAKANKTAPNFNRFFWRSFTWSQASLLLFLVGSIVALFNLSVITLPQK